MLTNYSRQAIQNAVFGLPSAFGPLVNAPEWWIGLSSSAPTAAGGTGVMEPTGGGYTRVKVPAASWSIATAFDPAVVENSVSVLFPTATASWLAGAALTYSVLYDAQTAGNLLAYAALSTSASIASGDVVKYIAGALVFNLS